MLIKNYKHLVKILNQHYDQSQLLFINFIKYCLNHQELHHQHHLQRPSSPYSFIKYLDVMSMMLLLMLLPLCCVDAVGYSYTRFVGPVAGPERKIYVNDADADAATDGKTPPYHVNVLPRLDYVAKPEYEFAYGVEDADAHILHNRNEMRDGDVVKGVYSLIDPDGALRVVKYTADEMNGFQAEVIRNGVSSLHGQLQNDYNRIPPSKIINNNYYKPDHEQHHYPQSQTHTHEKGDINKHYPSANTYTPNWEQLQKINHQQTYNPHVQYQAPPQPPIIYHYNNNDGGDDVDDGSNSSSNDSDSDYHDNEQQQQQYEVHEKPNNDDDHYNNEEDDEDDNDHIIDTQIVGHKKKKYYPKENYDDDDDDEEDDDDYNEEDNSEEFEDYNETGHNAKNSKESDEYY